jgi:hypothetical protein
VRESARHAAALTLQAQRLDQLQSSVESGNSALIGQITTFASQKATRVGETPVQQAQEDRSVTGRRKLPQRSRNGTEYKFRLALPHRLVKCIWEFSVHGCDNAWTFQLSPVNIRPARTYAFDFVRAGDVNTVRELMRSRQLSIRDREPSSRGSRTLLEVSEVHCSLAWNWLAYYQTDGSTEWPPRALQIPTARDLAPSRQCSIELSAEESPETRMA